MISSYRAVFLALGAPPQPGQAAPPPWTSLVMLIPILIIFYVVMIRGPQKKAKEHAEMLKTVRPGDKIITSGGIVAVVITVKDKTLNVRSADAKFEITKSAIAEITERGGDTHES
jgi:preprotein translocase subunit YajC